MLEFNGTAIVIAISFVIFVILEKFLFYRPMQKMLDERDNYIKNNENEAEVNIAKAQSLTDEKDKKIAEAKSKSAKILNDTSIKTQEEFDVAVKNAKTKNNCEINELKQNLEQEKLAVQEELRAKVSEHASMIIAKILKKDVSMINVSNEVIDKAMRGEL